MGLLVWILQNFWALVVCVFIALVALRILYRCRKYGASRAELAHILRRSPFYLMVLVFCFFAAAPFLIMFLHSFKGPLALILVYPSFTVPFSMWLLQGFFKAVPPELEEAALVDGYNRIEAFIRVVLPLSLPGIISTIVFTFTLTLHEFIYALVFITDTQQRTLSVGVPTELILGDVYFWQPLLAAALIIALPVGFAYNLFLDSLVQGFTMGAVKG